MKRATDVLALILDDNSNICRVIGTVLQSEGVQVLLACSADEGLEIVRSKPVDVLFTNLQLPGEDGIGVIRKLLQIRPQLAVVVLTGAAALESAIEALRLGVCDYVTKPIDRQKIVTALSRALNLRDLKKVAERDMNFQNPGDSGDLAAIGHTSGKPQQVTLVSASTRMREVVALAAKIAPLEFPALIQGETGVGKRLLARSIHCQSARAGGPFLQIACGAVRDAPAQSGLFASQQTGTPRNQTWSLLTEMPDGSTLLLEDVDELPLWAQVRLLEVVEGSWLPSPGTSIGRPGDVRVIASTTADLKTAVSAGRFHHRLYDHLNLMPITIPPLRKRREDIKPLAIFFLEQFRRGQKNNGAPYGQLSNGLWELLHCHHWPGNVRQLAIVLARLALLGERTVIDSFLQEQLKTPEQPGDSETISIRVAGDLKAMEHRLVSEVVRRHGGNKAAAARALGMHRRTLYRILESGRQKGKSRQVLG